MAPRFKICPDCMNGEFEPVPDCGNTDPHGRHHYQVRERAKGRFAPVITTSYMCYGKDRKPACNTCGGTGTVPNG
jgi:hypothetical protein